MPTNLFPALRYRDPKEALRFLCDAFGFTEKAVHESDGRIAHAEVQLGDGGILMFGEGDPGSGSATLYAYVEDVRAHYERARDAGATIHEEPTDRAYGSTEYTTEDSEGHIWTFGTYDPYK